ncbi:hypothetical protein AACH06_21495 [Ideonella sp. DXS29W]|uniref:Uncharacterized protein n=1 Tax=Ideonella lacteola TaxID=2984193 RepID=A0ABU9BTV6_9BURK
MQLTAPLLSVIQCAAEAVLTLTDTLDEADLLRSRLTRAEVQRQLALMADTLAAVQPQAQGPMPEIDWAGWRTVAAALARPGRAQDEALWFAARSLAPATLSWLRFYRPSLPQLFDVWG